MEDWGIEGASHRIPLILHNPGLRERTDEPTEVAIHFSMFRPSTSGLCLTDPDGRPVPCQVLDSSEAEPNRLQFANICFLANLLEGQERGTYSLYLSDRALSTENAGGISRNTPVLKDGYRRLDTGTYTLELCTGTAGGDGSSKWGIRHFEHNDQQVNLIHQNCNAFGGVYGPFFTPENGLVNPPAHATAEFEPMAEGPVVCEYRMRVRVPDGLRPELRSKNLDVRWRFYHRSHWFVRSYYPDDYETVIDGRDCRNRITVGDEIESGKGNLLLSTYKHHDGTRYRAGDLYAEILLARIEDLKKREPELIERAMESLGIDPSEAPAQWSWDHYWRLFCVIEELLPESVLREETERIWKSANEIVWSDTEHNLMKFTEDFVDVNGEPTQTIFPTDARKTCEYSPLTGYSFVRYVNRTIPRMQIVQRHDSGWVNWGTNGENEYPELPSGSTIWSAYGQFDDWEAEAEKMENPVAVSVQPLERYYRL